MEMYIVRREGDEEGGERAFLASGLSKKRLTVQPFRVKLLLEVVGFFFHFMKLA